MELRQKWWSGQAFAGSGIGRVHRYPPGGVEARGVLKKELIGHLRSKRRIRRSQHSRIFKDSRGQIVDAISIRERPAEIEDRAVPGHWKGELIGGTKNSHIATLVERHSQAPNIPAAVIDVGSRAVDGQTQNLQGGHECQSVLL
jgi:IS30 family transposase